MNIKVAMIAGLLGIATGEVLADEQQFERKVAADPAGNVEISNVAGSLDIVGSERAEVEVRGELGEGVEKVDVTGGGARTYVKVILRRNSDDGDARLTVTVPKGSQVTTSSVSADINSKGVQGRQTFTTVSGAIDAEVAGADAQMKSVSGDILLRGAQQSSDMRLSTVSGNLRVDRGAGQVDATSISGDVSVEVDPARNVRLHSTSGDLAFHGKLEQGANLDVETVSGEVKLNASGKSGYEYEVSTFAGDIQNCFGQKAERTEQHGPGSRLNGKVGDGSGRVRIKSMSGDVSICDK